MSSTAKKNSRIRNMIIAAAVIVVLIGAYLGVSALNKPAAAAPAKQQGDMMIAEFDASKIKEIRYTWKGETIDMTFNDVLYKWQLASDKNYPISFEIAGSMASAISQIKANRVVEESREHFADYGLDKPYLDITAVYEEGQARYLMGDYNSMLNGYYFNIDGSDTVYLIPAGLNPFFEYGLLDLAQKDTMPSLTDSSISELRVTVSQTQLDDESVSVVAEALTRIASSGLTTVGYLNDESQVRLFGFDHGYTMDLAYKEAQTLENTDASGETNSYTSTVHVDKTAEYTVAVPDGDENAAYLTCGSGLVYAVDRETVMSIISVIESAG